MSYSKELRDAMVAKMLPPNNQSITRISKQEGIPEATLRNWRNGARANGHASPATDTSSEQWSTEDKFLIVVETAAWLKPTSLNITERKACMPNRLNDGGIAQEAARLNKALKQKDKEFKSLEKELNRKEKALAETAALLVLRKKANEIWGKLMDDEEE